MTLIKNSQEPIYKQIQMNILESIKTGRYNHGDKLPTEREMSQRLGISRGTVKKAYEELEKNGDVTIVWGSGVFVGRGPGHGETPVDEDKWVSRLVEGLENKGYCPEEAESFIHIHVKKLIHPYLVNVAAVDCNIETLDILKSQLSYIKDLNYTSFLLADVERFEHRHSLFDEFDLIFTTTTHYEDLAKLVPDQKDKIIKAVVAPDKNTLINLFKLSSSENVGMLVRSSRFMRIVKRNIEPYGLTVLEKDCILEKDLTNLNFDGFIQGKKALIMPPLSALSLKRDVYDSILEFNRRGGEIITFNYSIEKGSLIYIEEKISNIIKAKEW